MLKRFYLLMPSVCKRKVCNVSEVKSFTGSGGAISKTNGGSFEHETFINCPQVGIELHSPQVKCSVGDASSPRNAMLAAENPAEGNAVNRNKGSSTAASAVASTVADKIYSEPSGTETSLSNRVTNNHRDITACHGMVNYVIN